MGLFTRLRMINYLNGVGMSIPTDIKVQDKRQTPKQSDPCWGIDNIAKYIAHCPDFMQISLRAFLDGNWKSFWFRIFDVFLFYI